MSEIREVCGCGASITVPESRWSVLASWRKDHRHESVDRDQSRPGDPPGEAEHRPEVDVKGSAVLERRGGGRTVGFTFNPGVPWW